MAIDVIKRKSGTVYRTRVSLPGRKRRSKCFKRKVDAVRFEAKMLADVRRFDQAESKKILFEDFADLFMKNHASTLQFTSRQKYEGVLRLYLIPRFRGRWVNSLSNLDVAEFAAEIMNSGKSASMQYFLFFAFKSLLKKAFHWGYLDYLPGAGTKAPRKANTRTEFWTAEEASMFLLAMKDHPRLPLYMLALNTGLRAGEILGLKWDAIDFDRKLIFVKRTFCQKLKVIKDSTKTHKERFIAMNDAVLQMLLEMRSCARTLELFTPESLKCKDITHLARVFEMDCKRTGVRAIRFHDLRHTFATQFVTNGGSIFHLAGVLGHSTTAMTGRYAHFCENQAREVASVVSFRIPSQKNVIQIGNGHKVVTDTEDKG